jgi:hypothetical protein
VKYTKELKEKIQNKWLRADEKALISSRVVNDYSLRNEISKECLVECDSMAEYTYCILNDIFTKPKCICDNPVKFKRFGLGYAKYCSTKCRANDSEWQQQVKKTRLEKYGVEHIAQLDYEREKRRKQLNKNRNKFDYSYSVENRKQTILKKYGDVNTGWLPQAVETRVRNGSMIPRENISTYQKYKNKVSNLTNRQDLSFLENYEKRGVFTRDNQEVYHVDHVVSVSEGFRMNVPPEIIASPPNLRCIPASDNMEKNHRSDMSVDQLYEAYEKWKKGMTD